MRTVVVGDLHLARGTAPAVGVALARLVDLHAGARLVVAGDAFDFSADHPTSSVEATLAAQPAARAALACHLDRGGELWLAAGNHDAEVADDGFVARLAAALGARDTSRIRATPWFFRAGDAHVEHGHVFDADNAPAHPLVRGAPSLGVRFVRDFVAKAGAHAYLNRNDEKPLELLLSSFALYGRRAPFVIYRYFHTAFDALARSGPMHEARGEVEAGEALVAGYARSAGVPEDEVRRLVALGAPPTMESFARTFARLYLDRVVATAALAGGAVALATGRRRAGAALAGLGVLGLAVSWGIAHDRYGGRVHDSLRRGAADVRAATGCRLVVLGHTHRACDEDGYANTGSFAFPRDGARPYLVLDGARAERHFLAA